GLAADELAEGLTRWPLSGDSAHTPVTEAPMSRARRGDATTVSLELPASTVAGLREKAASVGQPLEVFLLHLAELGTSLPGPSPGQAGDPSPAVGAVQARFTCVGKLQPTPV